MIFIHNILRNFINLGTDNLICKSVRNSRERRRQRQESRAHASHAGNTSHEGQHLEIRPNKVSGTAPRWVNDQPAHSTQPTVHNPQPVTHKEQPATYEEQPAQPSPFIKEGMTPSVTNPKYPNTIVEKDGKKVHQPIALPVPTPFLPSGKVNPDIGPLDRFTPRWFVENFINVMKGINIAHGHISWIDRVHFLQRLKERWGRNKSPLILSQLKNPLFITKGTNELKRPKPEENPESVSDTPSTVYVRLHHSVIVLDDEVLKSYFPNHMGAQAAIKRGWRGEILDKRLGDPDTTSNIYLFNREWNEHHTATLTAEERRTSPDPEQLLYLKQRAIDRLDPGNYEMEDDDIGTYDPENFNPDDHNFRSLFDAGAAIKRGFAQLPGIDLSRGLYYKKVREFNRTFLESIDQTDPKKDPANFDITLDDFDKGFDPKNFDPSKYRMLPKRFRGTMWDTARRARLPRNFLRRYNPNEPTH